MPRNCILPALQIYSFNNHHNKNYRRNLCWDLNTTQFLLKLYTEKQNNINKPGCNYAMIKWTMQKEA